MPVGMNGEALLARLRAVHGLHVEALAAFSTHDLEHHLLHHAPHLLLIDVALCDALDAATAQSLRSAQPACRWIVGWPAFEPRWLVALLACDVRGAVGWGDGTSTMERAIGAVCAGELWFARAVLQQLYQLARDGHGSAAARGDADAANNRTRALTPREAQVLALIRAGLTNKQIAQRLGSSVNTVKKHIDHAYTKSGLHKRRQVRA